MPIIDPTDSEDVKLNQARDHFLEQISRNNARRRNMEKAFAFAAGDQWDLEAKRTVESENRPALVFNLIAPMLREICGANEDQRREARVMPVGMEDTPTSGVINHLHERLARDKKVKLRMVEKTVFDKCLKCGVGYAFLDAQPSPEDPNEIQVTLESIHPTEVVPDMDCKQENFSDAKHFYWHRWLSEAEFKAFYPEHGEKWEQLSAQLEDEMGPEFSTDLDHLYGLTELQRGILMDERFFNRKERKIRVIHLEYQAPKKIYLAWDPRPSPIFPERAVGYTEVSRSTYLALKRSGITPVNTSSTKEWRWFEFTGKQVLYDDAQPLPIGRPQIFPFTCYIDDLTGEAYGVVKDLMDPQQEVNKRYSSDLLMQMQGAIPGLISTRGAFGDDAATVEARIRQPGFYLEAEAGSQWEFRDPPRAPVGVDSESSKNLLQLISGISLDPIQGPHAQEAVGVALLRYRRSIQAITPVLTNFRDFQMDVLDAMVHVILLTFSDEQIERMLGEQNRYRVDRGVVYDIEQQTQIVLSELRAIRWNIELETAASNTTQQLMVMQMMLDMHAKGIPMDEEVIVDMLPVSKDQRQALKNNVRQSKQAQSQAMEMQRKGTQEQLAAILKTEALKSAAKIKGDEERVALDEQKAVLEFIAKMVKAYGDGSETSRKKMRDLMDLFSHFAELNVQDHRAVINQGVNVGRQAGAAPQPRATPPAPASLMEEPAEVAT